MGNCGQRQQRFSVMTPPKRERFEHSLCWCLQPLDTENGIGGDDSGAVSLESTQQSVRNDVASNMFNVPDGYSGRPSLPLHLPLMIQALQEPITGII